MNLLSRFGGRLWDPLREMGQLQHEMGRLLNSARPFGLRESREAPPVNVYANDHEILITLEVSGIDPAHVEVVVTGSSVVLSGKRVPSSEDAGTAFHRRERTMGEFNRKLQLPFEVDSDKTEASYDKGVLSVRLTRPESNRPRKIAVKTA
ncbi:MAG: Hsp20/alpha crystallin family protein [Planctomycetota bacterium]|nr:Hsp20/alpha crystallin family protein [Planctomycetota bacterium]